MGDVDSFLADINGAGNGWPGFFEGRVAASGVTSHFSAVVANSLTDF